MGLELVRLLPYGAAALLVELDNPDDVLSFAAAAKGLPDVFEVVPAAGTVLVRVDPARRNAVAARLTDLGEHPPRPATDQVEEIVLDVRYDGPDIDSVATELGISAEELVTRHCAPDYIVAFCGFSPGFAYLRGLDESLHVARLAEPRTRVPAGSVGIAGEFSGVYPRESPGGWRLLGRTDAPLWDLDRTPPALLAPGTRVRFHAT